VRAAALERFYAGVVAECEEISRDSTRSAEDRYHAIYRLTRDRDKDLARMSDFRRSTALFQLAVLRSLRLVTDEEMSRFSEESQQFARHVFDIGR
jgi:hypothetical protein